MSEYWKSTPKYWCKYCKIFVRDTKLEKTNHEATPKHQGNLKRFLRDLHKGHEREERDKQRAKDEVDRLNGVVSGSATGSKGAPWETKPATPTPLASRQATPADRKKQLAQLAELGVAVPEDFRKEMAMVGDWQITSQRMIYDTLKKEEDDEDTKPSGLSFGVRKRKLGDLDEEDGIGEITVKRGWGTTTRTYPESGEEANGNLDALLKSTTILMSKGNSQGRTVPTDGSSQPQINAEISSGKEDQVLASSPPQFKREESSGDGGVTELTLLKDATEAASIKEEDPTMLGPIFKKRKAKPIRQK